MKAKHPIQPLEYDEAGILRFKSNQIIRYLADGRLNELACMNFSREDRQQLAQLIGYSLRGYSELSYVTPAAWAAAEREASKVLKPK